MAERLPEAEWTSRADLLSLARAIGTDNLRWVGGAVRDTILGSAVHDIDAATPLTPAEVIERLDAIDIRTVPTGIDHGTITAILDTGNVEITTLRQDVATDGRRATIEFARDWREDAARRDFTINALYAHPETLEISDYFGGVNDLKARRVRFIGDARQRIAEDHLRILRYFRFQARFGSELDQQAESACADMAEKLRDLSRERVGWELVNLLSLPDPADTVARMRQIGVLPVVMPEAGSREIETLRNLVAAEKEQGFDPDPMRRMGALLPALPDIVDDVCGRLRLSRSQRSRLLSIAERKSTDCDDPVGLAYHEGADNAVDRLLLRGCNARLLKEWERPELPLKGGEIVDRGVTPGPKIATIMRSVELQWIAEGFPGRSRVESLLDAELGRLG